MRGLIATHLPALLAAAKVCVCLLAAGPARGAQAPEAKREPLLAVMDIVNNSGEFASFVEGMPDMLITELLKTGEVKLVERTKVQTAMKALKLETSGLTQETNLELGKWLGVDGILFGTFNRVGEQYRLDVRAVDVQTGKIRAAASATCSRQNVIDIVPEIGNQLRLRLAPPAEGRTQPPPAQAAAPAAPPAPAVDSCPLNIQFKMIPGLFSEGTIPYQRVRVYLDGRHIHTSGVVDAINRYFPLYKGNIPAGSHVLALVHGVVDKQGRWLREMESQPETYAFAVRKGDSPGIQYKLHAYDDWFKFQDFKLTYHNVSEGDD